MSGKGDLITQYLLGVLPEPQRAALEIECFADKERFEEVAAAESDLIDDYLRGKLSAEEHTQFEEHFLSSSRRRERVHAAKILLRSISSGVATGKDTRRPVSGRSSWAALRERKGQIQWALAAAAIVLLALGGVWLTIETSRLRNQVLKAQAEYAAEQERRQELDQQLEDQRGRAQQLSEELASARDQLTALEAQNDKLQSASPNLLSFFLTAGIARGGSAAQTVTIPPGTKLVKLRLTMKRSDYQSYRAVVRTPEGTEIWNQSVTPTLLRSGAVVVLQIPASRFTRNDYILKIIGTTSNGEIDDASSSYFRVER